MLGRPLADGCTATAKHGDVESVDLRFEEDFDAGSRRGLRARGLRDSQEAWLGLAHEPLERPVAASLDVRRHARERHEAAELAAASRELERGDVVLHAVVVARERRGPKQVDRAVGADEAAARQRRPDSHEKSEEGRGRGGEHTSHPAVPPVRVRPGWPELGPRLRRRGSGSLERHLWRARAEARDPSVAPLQHPELAGCPEAAIKRPNPGPLGLALPRPDQLLGTVLAEPERLHEAAQHARPLGRVDTEGIGAPGHEGRVAEIERMF